MSDCVFCDIVAGHAPASIVYENEVALAFMDIHPVHPGHTLVIPRTHVVDLSSCPPGLVGELFQVSARIAPAIATATNAAGFNVWTANGKAAGQEVFHLHLHILPRYHDDTFGLRFPQGYPEESSREDLEELAEEIKRVVRR